MFPLWYSFAGQSCEEQLSLSTSLRYLFCSCHHRYYSGLRLPALRLSFFFWLADILFIYTLWKENAGPLQLTYSPCLTWIVSTTPQRHAKSHHNDKCIYCLPPWPRCRPSDTLGFRCSIAIPAILLSTLSLHVTVTDSRLASNAVVSSLFDRISTCRIARPLLDARSGTRYSHSTPFDIIWTFVHTLLTVPDPELHGAPLLPDPKQPPQTDDSNLSVCRVQNWQFSHFFL